MLRVVLFNIFVGVMEHGIECTLSKFADDTELSGAIDMLEGRDAIQKDLDGLRRWTHANLMKFKMVKCKVLHLGQGNPKHKYILSGEWLESSPEEDLRVSADKSLNVSWQCMLSTPKANCILGCVRRSITSM